MLCFFLYYANITCCVFYQTIQTLRMFCVVPKLSKQEMLCFFSQNYLNTECLFLQNYPNTEFFSPTLSKPSLCWLLLKYQNKKARNAELFSLNSPKSCIEYFSKTIPARNAVFFLNCLKQAMLYIFLNYILYKQGRVFFP